MSCGQQCTLCRGGDHNAQCISKFTWRIRADSQPEPPTHWTDSPAALGSYTFPILKFQSSFLRWWGHIAHRALFIAERHRLRNITCSLFRVISLCGGVAFSCSRGALGIWLSCTGVHLDSSRSSFVWQETGNLGSCLSLETNWSVPPPRGPQTMLHHKVSWGSTAPRTHSVPPASRLFPPEEERASCAAASDVSMWATWEAEVSHKRSLAFWIGRLDVAPVSPSRGRNHSLRVWNFFKMIFIGRTTKKCTVQS